MTAADLRPGGSSGKEANGKAIPDHGCIGEAYRTLYTGAGTPLESTVATDIVRQAQDLTAADSRAKAKTQEWVTCMHSHGYDYASPMAAAYHYAQTNPTAPASAEEITTAVTDMTCRTQINYMGVLFTLEVAYENALIQRHIQELTQVRNGLDEERRRAIANGG